MVFTFQQEFTAGIANTLSGIPIIGDAASSLLGGIPIPIYLSESLTGIVIESESRSMDINAAVNGFADGSAPDLKQSPLNNEVNLNLLAEADNVILAVLLTMFDTIFQRLANQKYTLTYLNGPTTVFGGKLMGVNVTQGENDNLLRISIRISKANQGKPLANPDLKTAFRGVAPGGLLS